MMSFLEKIDAHLNNHRMESWEGTFRDYLPLVMDNPSLAQRSHSRIYNMVKSAGVRVGDDEKEHYAFFEEELFGINEPLVRVVEYFKAAAMGSDVGRRILLLYGPPSSGKSQLVILSSVASKNTPGRQRGPSTPLPSVRSKAIPCSCYPMRCDKNSNRKPAFLSRAICAHSVP
jgi:predicted Ser/Thr protein kinase